MTFTTIAIAVALIVFVLAKRVRGEAVREPKKLFLLPIVVGIIGLQNVSPRQAERRSTSRSSPSAPRSPSASAFSAASSTGSPW